MDYQFGIITDGKEPEKLQALVNSIHALEIPDYYSIVICGKIPTIRRVNQRIHRPELAEQGLLGAMRNEIVYNTDADIYIILDDDMILHDDFYTGIRDFAGEWDLMSCRILNPDGTRFWDWKTHNDYGDRLLDYDKTSPDVSLTGGLTIAKNEIFDRVSWSDCLGFYQAEDVDFTERCKEAGLKIVFNPAATVTHDAPYTQRGIGVVRL